MSLCHCHLPYHLPTDCRSVESCTALTAAEWSTRHLPQAACDLQQDTFLSALGWLAVWTTDQNTLVTKQPSFAASIESCNSWSFCTYDFTLHLKHSASELTGQHAHSHLCCMKLTVQLCGMKLMVRLCCLELTVHLCCKKLTVCLCRFELTVHFCCIELTVHLCCIELTVHLCSMKLTVHLCVARS